MDDPGQIVMTGDRRHDILGAKENNLARIGILYRFGDRKELMRAGVDQIVLTVVELKDVMLHHLNNKL